MSIQVDLATHVGLLPSPCIDVCNMDPLSGLCDGCARTIGEIVEWGAADEARKRVIWIEIVRRREKME
jgi:predicted Fe-S protein YdhL (DUF1289 family)